jgi:hypothetical protein
MYVTNKGESIRKSAYVCCVDLQKVFDTVEVTDAFKIPCDRIKKIRVSENGGLNQSKHQNSTIQATRFFFFIRSHVTTKKWRRKSNGDESKSNGKTTKQNISGVFLISPQS